MELFRQLKILYMQLPYILYKKKYLIPNAPNWDNCCMKYHFDKLENLQMNKEFLLHHENKDQEYFKKIIKEIKQNMNKQEYVKQYEAFKKQRKLYHQTFIQPLKQFKNGIRPQFIYFRENRDQIIKKVRDESLPANLRSNIVYQGRIYKLYQKLSDSQKKYYQKRCQQYLQQVLKKRYVLQDKYKLPTKKLARSYILFLREKYQPPIKRSMYQLYTNLPKQAKSYYIEQERILKLEDKKNMQDFLQKFGLTAQDFKYIQNISKNFKKAKNDYINEKKKNRKAKKDLIIKTKDKENKIESNNKQQTNQQYEEWELQMKKQRLIQRQILDQPSQESDDI